MIKKYIKYLLFALILSFFFMPSFKADTLREMYNNLNALKSEKAAADNQKELSEEKYNETIKNINTNELKIKQGQQDIEDSKKKIIELNKEIDEKKIQINELLVFLQVSEGGNSYIEYIFGASDFVDFIFRTAMVSQLSDNNDKLIKEMNDLIEENIQLQEDIKKEEENLKKLNAQLEKDLITLGNQISKYAEETMTYDEKISELSRTIKYYEDAGCEMDEDVMVCIEMPVAFGFSKPVKNSCITSGFGMRWHPIYQINRFHYGIDLNGWTGKPVYAAAAGIVVAVNRLSSFGNYVVIKHYVNETKYSTIYMHLNAFNVKIGDIVSTSSIIGFVGSTGDSTGPHLHFGLLRGWYIEEYTGDAAYNYNCIDPNDFVGYGYC